MKTMYCINCGGAIAGRSDKKFCNDTCKSAYHYEQNMEEADSHYRQIDKQLKLNRRILKGLNLILRCWKNSLAS